MKYFGIKADEPTLGDIEQLNDSIARLEAAVNNLHEREASITQSVNPPGFIQKHYMSSFMEKVGVELSPITVPYPEYVFEYVSAGGNSSQRTSVTFNTPTIDALIETLGQKIRWRKSAAGQRALMTTKLRSFIKERDNHTCQYCSVSVAAEPHLLLEVDHIVPVSRGGLSAPENLQTLCWRCNRTKSNKTTDTVAVTKVEVEPIVVTPELVVEQLTDEVDSVAPASSVAATPAHAWRPGDISNGHILGSDNQWHPLAGGQ